jgi:pimeloyl-ACP methyl ester carboxylesterase
MSATAATAGTSLTAKNRSVEIEGATLVYRRFGDRESGAPPLLCLQHFRGNLDNWDPALVDRLAADREVVLFDNRGVGGSSGVVPDNVDDMARDALHFVDAVGLTQVDLLGFSLGGFVAQENRFIRLFFSGSEESRAKGRQFLERISARTIDRDEPTNLATRDAQLEALARYGIPDPSKLARLAGITQPAFVANGDADPFMITENSRLLAEHLPNAQLRIYPDAGHGFLDQYPEQFADHVRAFLNGG